MAAVVCFIGVMLVIVAVAGWAYLLGAPIGAVIVPGASVASPNALVTAVHRVAHGGPQLARI
eukprot:76741-Prymnesium_polylepis.1